MEPQRNIPLLLFWWIPSEYNQERGIIKRSFSRCLSPACSLFSLLGPQKKSTKVLSLAICLTPPPSDPLTAFLSHQTIPIAIQNLTKRPRGLTGHQSATAPAVLWSERFSALIHESRSSEGFPSVIFWHFGIMLHVIFLTIVHEWTESRLGRERRDSKGGRDRDPESVSWPGHCQTGERER